MRAETVPELTNVGTVTAAAAVTLAASVPELVNFPVSTILPPYVRDEVAGVGGSRRDDVEGDVAVYRPPGRDRSFEGGVDGADCYGAPALPPVPGPAAVVKLTCTCRPIGCTESGPAVETAPPASVSEPQRTVNVPPFSMVEPGLSLRLSPVLPFSVPIEVCDLCGQLDGPCVLDEPRRRCVVVGEGECRIGQRRQRPRS